MVESDPETPSAGQVRWVFQTLERIHAGESIPYDEVASHFAPQFLQACPPEQILAGYRDVAPVAARIAMLGLEFDRDFEDDRAQSLIATLDDGSRCRWWFNVEAAPPHRIQGQLRTRQQLAEHATRHGHMVRWVDAGHGFAVDQPELSGQIITDYLATLGPV